MRKMIINGFPHSGTTILRRILGDHPDVYDWEPEAYDVDVTSLLEEPDGEDLLLRHVALDAYWEYVLAKKQMKELGYVNLPF